MRESIFKITENAPLTETVYKMKLQGDVSDITSSGQFVNIKLDGLYLRRPISVCDCEDGVLTLIYRRTRRICTADRKISGTENYGQYLEQNSKTAEHNPLSCVIMRVCFYNGLNLHSKSAYRAKSPIREKTESHYFMIRYF